jgi:hypothetical protein
MMCEHREERAETRAAEKRVSIRFAAAGTVIKMLPSVPTVHYLDTRG